MTRAKMYPIYCISLYPSQRKLRVNFISRISSIEFCRNNLLIIIKSKFHVYFTYMGIHVWMEKLKRGRSKCDTLCKSVQVRVTMFHSADHRIRGIRGKTVAINGAERAHPMALIYLQLEGNFERGGMVATRNKTVSTTLRMDTMAP